VNFALDGAIDALRKAGALSPGARRVAIIGPGLDFTDKAEGYDVYPVQTIQPFALIDSLVRRGLAGGSDLRLTTFDLSPRVNGHLKAAAERGRNGNAYTLQLPLTRDDPAHTWEPALVDYWKSCGNAIGSETAPVAVPPAAGRVDLRAVRVRPDVVALITPIDMNIVVQRLAGLADADKFDLVVATNVLVYYDAFEQGLALANVAAMLKPGGVFLTNYLVHPSPPLERSASVVTPIFWDRQKNGDTMFGYRRVDAAPR
jgi:SAM-dependent methyltransferase